MLQINKIQSSQDFYRGSNQVIQEISTLFPQDIRIQNLLREYLLDHNFVSLIETLMQQNSSDEFVPYIREYEVLKGAPIREVIRIFSVSYLNRVSLCRYPFIFIDMAIWQTLSEDAKKIVLFHELGHCDLMRGHEPPGMLSIMSEEQNFFLTVRVHLKIGKSEEKRVLNARAKENLKFLYGELFSKEGNFSDDIQSWIQKNEDEGIDVSNILHGYFQNYFYISSKVHY